MTTLLCNPMAFVSCREDNGSEKTAVAETNPLLPLSSELALFLPLIYTPHSSCPLFSPFCFSHSFSPAPQKANKAKKIESSALKSLDTDAQPARHALRFIISIPLSVSLLFANKYEWHAISLAPLPPLHISLLPLESFFKNPRLLPLMPLFF